MTQSNFLAGRRLTAGAAAKAVAFHDRMRAL
jgi:hypothetical protein